MARAHRRRSRQPHQGRDGASRGSPWSDATTRDRFKFGGPDTVVTGIATTFMGTFEAITQGQRAAAST